MTMTSRRSFFQSVALGSAALGIARSTLATPPIQGFEHSDGHPGDSEVWQPVSDRKIRIGIVGFGFCQFGAQFGFQDHPSVVVSAVSDLVPERCAGLAKACRCAKTYPSLEELIKDDSLEAVFVATDAPSHARHCIATLEHGKHVACAVPATFGSLEDADRLYQAAKKSGLNYMMFETSVFHDDLYAMRQIFHAGGFGKVVYAEGEYYHYKLEPLPSFRNWRVGMPPQWYPTHSNAYYVGVTGQSFAEVSCLGVPSTQPSLQPDNNRYRNSFGTEIAIFRTSEGGLARMVQSFDTPGPGWEKGRLRGELGSYFEQYEGKLNVLPNLTRPPLPPIVHRGLHGGSHGNLMHEFIRSILESRRPLVDISMSLNMTVAGIVAHASALKGGERLKIPQFSTL